MSLPRRADDSRLSTLASDVMLMVIDQVLSEPAQSTGTRTRAAEGDFGFGFRGLTAVGRRAMREPVVSLVESEEKRKSGEREIIRG